LATANGHCYWLLTCSSSHFSPRSLITFAFKVMKCAMGVNTSTNMASVTERLARFESPSKAVAVLASASANALQAERRFW